MKKYLLLVILLISFLPVVVFAEECDTSKVTITSISLEQTNNVLELEDATATGKNINLNIGMTEVGDNVKYKFVVKNDSNEDYLLDRNSASLSADYVDYLIESDDNSSIVKAKSSKTMYLSIQYKKPVPASAYQNGVFNNQVTMKVNLSSGDNIANPNTGIKYFLFIAFVVLIMIIGLIIFRKKRLVQAMVFLVGIILVPIGANALCKCDIDISSNIEFKEPKICDSFARDSWSKISNNIRNNTSDCYHVGDTKEIDMGTFGTHTVRIANISTASECATDGFSQTGCGFVVEFTDIIVKHRMNPFEQNANVNGDGNKGGWEYSEIRQYVNNDIYNALPSDLKTVIIDTFVVSGYGDRDSANFLTTDKLYYFAYREVSGGGVYANITDTRFTRQLDFYNNYGTNRSIAIKKYEEQPACWCFRTAAQRDSGFQSFDIFYGIRPSDGWSAVYNSCDGVSPAFRVG